MVSTASARGTVARERSRFYFYYFCYDVFFSSSDFGCRIRFFSHSRYEVLYSGGGSTAAAAAAAVAAVVLARSGRCTGITARGEGGCAAASPKTIHAHATRSILIRSYIQLVQSCDAINKDKRHACTRYFLYSGVFTAVYVGTTSLLQCVHDGYYGHCCCSSLCSGW